MTNHRLIIQTLRYYWRQNLMLALGVAVSTAVLTGALIVGASVQYSLEKIVKWRLGNITHTVSAGDRYFSENLAGRLQAETNDPTASLLMLDGMAASAGGKYQLPRVQVLGIDDNFSRVTGVSNFAGSLKPGEALVSRNLAQQLHLKINDELLIRMKKLSVIPLNAPFVSDAEAINSIKVIVVGILSDDSMGRFNLRNIQTAPYNLFLSLEFLNEVMDAHGRANHLLIASEAAFEIEPALDRALFLEDINLNTEFDTVHHSWEIASDRVFINRVIQEALESEPVSAEPILTYFVNSISQGNQETPYSFVSSTSDATLGPHEIIINDWLGNDLGVRVGDTVKLDYFIIGPLRKLKERSHHFVIRKIVPLSGEWADKSLMPKLPGLSDVGNCRDWETGVPIDLEKIRPKDEDYWDEYQGIPKAYISYGTARKLWTNRFGESTTLRITSPDINQGALEKSILALIRPSALGFQVNDVRNQGDQAARSGVDFSQLFLGLSFFLLLASVLLTALLFNLNTRTRMHQLATLSFLGFTHRKVKGLWLTEGLLVSIAGALLGLLLAIGYNQVVFNALNSIWSTIVRTQILETAINLQTLLIGFSTSVLISLVAIYISLDRLLKQSTHKLQTHTLTPAKKWVKTTENALLFFSSFFTVALVIWSYQQTSFQNTSMFFISGALLLLSCLLFVRKTFQHRSKSRHLPILRIRTIILRNLTHNSHQSFLVIAVFAIATFIVLSTGAHRKDLFYNAHEKSSGTGGFLYYAETTVPILNDLNDPEVRFLSGMTKDYDIVQIREHPGDDASCLNLNRTKTPGIMGINPHDLTGRFRFINQMDDLEMANPWSSLQSGLGENIIPAVADQSVIQWGLGMAVGDTLQYLDEHGEMLSLKLIGGLANSIFQGNVLIADDHFLRHFPSSSGSNIMLVDGNPIDQTNIAGELRNSLRNHGLNLQSAPERLANFNSVENTYLSIFLILGGMGLMIGTLGLAIVLTRNLLDRKKELGIMRATGFRDRLILNLITREHFYLLFIGVGIGLLSAMLATLPSWLNPNVDFSLWSILILFCFIIGTGIFWILVLTTRFLKVDKIVSALSSE